VIFSLSSNLIWVEAETWDAVLGNMELLEVGVAAAWGAVSIPCKLQRANAYD
jgi:hypothetical protein